VKAADRNYICEMHVLGRSIKDKGITHMILFNMQAKRLCVRVTINPTLSNVELNYPLNDDNLLQRLISFV